MRETKMAAVFLQRLCAGTVMLGLLLCAPGALAAQTAQTADLSLRLDIPEEIGLEVDGEFVFDLSRAVAGQGQDACVDRFPPAPGCPIAFYFPTSATFHHAAVGDGLTPGTVMLSFIDNLASGTLHLRHSIGAEWIGGDPGIPTTAIQSASAAAGRERAHFEPLPTLPEEFLTVVAPRGLARADRVLRLALPRDARVTFTPQPVTVRITYEILHTPS
ncbi:MAG: hypothetical protein ABI968_00180 [Acidobacteriota bacterium]